MILPLTEAIIEAATHNVKIKIIFQIFHARYVDFFDIFDQRQIK